MEYIKKTFVNLEGLSLYHSNLNSQILNPIKATITDNSDAITAVSSQMDLLSGSIDKMTVNGKNISKNPILSSEDIGAQPAGSYVTIVNKEDYSLDPTIVESTYDTTGSINCNFCAIKKDESGAGIVQAINGSTIRTLISKAAAAGSSSVPIYINDQGDTKIIDSLSIPGWIESASGVRGAVFNDYSDSIEVPEDTIIEPGYCYCFNGNKYYKSTTYLDEGIMGIHSDTSGINVGRKGRGKELDISTSGFVLAYVDKEYKPGTPLTCTKNGYLTEIKMEDKIKYPERIVGTFWKKELNTVWEPQTANVKVNGRSWIKIK